MKISELRTKTPEILVDLLREKRARIDELRFLFAQKKSKDTKELRRIRRDVARILTLRVEADRAKKL